MKLKKAIFFNRAPFEHLELNFSRNINALTGFNGSGKTTIISHIADSFYELAKNAHYDDFESHPTSLYRMSSELYTIDKKKPSIVYLEYEHSLDDKYNPSDKQNNQCYRYIDILKVETANFDHIPEKISNEFDINKYKDVLEKNLLVKTWTVDGKEVSKEDSEQIFNSNVMAYFPYYRNQDAFFLTELYKPNITFNTDLKMVGTLVNKIEINNNIAEIVNWIMDVVLDFKMNESKLVNDSNELKILTILNIILTKTLYQKDNVKYNFGIGKRYEGSTRLAIVKSSTKEAFYPNVFQMSSGELSLLTLFAEILKQSDKILQNTSDLLNISGIVLIDEIDKHLHLGTQKDVVPNLLKMFPKLQFIISSHSPFINLGIGDVFSEEGFTIFDLNNNGLEVPPTDNELFREVYETMINQNERFKELYEELRKKIDENTKTLIVTEGCSDWQHLKAAYNNLMQDELFRTKYQNLEFDYLEYGPEGTSLNEDLTYDMGIFSLANMCEQCKRISKKRRIIFISDSDRLHKLFLKEENKDIEDNKEYKRHGNNTYSIILPDPAHRNGKGGYSIEHYYSDDEIKTEFDVGGIKRRLYLANEFNEDGKSLDGNLTVKSRSKCGESKITVLDSSDHVYDTNIENYVAISKNKFASFVLEKRKECLHFSFKNFEKIFSVIAEIASLPLE